tara:strand:- start:932 stop:1111 length:180 start_codon:yes stop_codon:yes gene_type:complete
MNSVTEGGDGNVLCFAGSIRAGKTELIRVTFTTLIDDHLNSTNVLYYHVAEPNLTVANL